MPERSVLVALPYSSHVGMLADDIAVTAGRAAKSAAGDRTDVTRYESLCSQLEMLAWEAAVDGAPQLALPETPAGPALPVAVEHLVDPLGSGLLSRLPEPAAELARGWLADGHLVVNVTIPLQAGARRDDPPAGVAVDVAERWEAPNGEEGAQAVEARFRALLASAVDGGTGEPIRPSGVHNRVLAQVLREYVVGTPDTRVDVPVAYRDGSTATHPFPLRCLPLVDVVPDEPDILLHLALLSIRHTEMDTIVDGAWLRNAEVSRPRPAAQTDDLVYEKSLSELDTLTNSGRRSVLLHIYQTGLDTAVVGFYRAVTAHLLRHPGSLSVVPMFAVVGRPGSAQPTRFHPDSPWTTEGRT